MAKKMTKEELEQDPLTDYYNRLQNYFYENKSTLIGGIIAVILVVGGVIGWVVYQQSQEEQARNLMTNAEMAFLNGNYQTALEGSEEEFTVGFEQIINNYSSTDAGNLARYYAAVCHYNLGNHQQALSYMQRYEVPEGILGVGPISFHAVIHTELGNHQQAAELYVQAAEWSTNESTTPYNYLEAAQAYNDAGNSEEAQRYARMVVEDYPESSVAADAERLLGMLAVNG